MKHRYISVAGTMGVGKTTMVKIIAKEFGFKPIYENFAANPFLRKFYQDMPRWAFHSQMFFLREKIRVIGEIRGRKNIVLDTPIYEDVFSYAKAQRVLGNMSEAEWRLYFDFYKIFEADLVKPDLIIFLSAPVETIYQRITKRTRNYEVKKKRDEFIRYLQVLDKLNRKWIMVFKRKLRIVEIDTEKFDYINDQNQKRQLIKTLKKYL